MSRRKPSTAPKGTDPMPYLLIEVNVSGAFVGADGLIVENNVADATLQFGWRADDMPAAATDAAILEALRRALGPVCAIIQMSMTVNKWAYFGEVEEPSLGGGTPTGTTLMTDGVRVRFQMPGTEGRA